MAAKTPAHVPDYFTRLTASVFTDVPPRAMILLVILLALLLIAPWLINDYLLTVLIVVLYFAFTGQAWNIMMGFAGQLSLGHAIYAGLGGYIAAVLFVFGYVLQAGLINPFISRPEHSQFLLLVALALIIVNTLLIIFGPDA